MRRPWKIISADVLEVLTERDLGGPFDAVFSDPPYGLGFMGRAWDHGVPSAEVWAALLPHLRPGANVALFGGTRTYHRLTCAVEDAGFEIRDSVACWVYGSGWPKPADVGKYVDKKLGAKRPVIRPSKRAGAAWAGKASNATGKQTTPDITQPATPEGARFDGWHANLKPAWEPCVLARKPLDGGLARNALEHGVAGLNVDGCRIGSGERIQPGNNGTALGRMNDDAWQARPIPRHVTTQGRWPTNVILTCEEALCGPGDPREIEHDPRCHAAVLDGSGSVSSIDAKSSSPWTRSIPPRANPEPVTASFAQENLFKSGGRPTARDTMRIIGNTAGRAEQYSRFFYVAKVSRAERGGVAHPCMKPQLLCEYVARLLLPPVRMDGKPRRILVPYSGSGSEMLGALRAGWDEVVGIEYDAGRDNPTGTTDHWAREAEHRITRWARTFAAELDLATEMADRGRVPSSQFKAAGADPQTWIDAGYARRDPDRRTWLVPGSEPFRRDGHSTDTRVWYRVHAPGLAVPPRP